MKTVFCNEKKIILFEKILYTIFFTGFFLILSIHSTYAANAPIDVSADEMTSSEKNSSVTFIGNVDARQGDIRIRANKMEVYYTPKSKEKEHPKDIAGSQQVEKIICTGKVEISRADWLGTGDRMDYMQRERKVVLTGNARAFKGQSQLQGSKIVYYLDEHRSEVVTDKKQGQKKGRVKVKLM